MNFEQDDNSTDDRSWADGSGRACTIDKCSSCFAEIDTTGDRKPQCPLCGSRAFFTVKKLAKNCPYRNAGCSGQKSSVTWHVCDDCLDCIAMHERVPRDSIRCVCDRCVPNAPPPIPRSAPSSGSPRTHASPVCPTCGAWPEDCTCHLLQAARAAAAVTAPRAPTPPPVPEPPKPNPFDDIDEWL